jgi:hypothetical protein
MHQEHNLDKTEEHIHTLMQLHDFASVQIALLTILILVLIFSIIAIYAQYSSVLTTILYIVILVDIVALFHLLISLLSRKPDVTFDFLSLGIFYGVVMGALLFLVFLYFGVNVGWPHTLITNNVLFVFFILLPIVFCFILWRLFLYPIYYERFKELTERVSQPSSPQPSMFKQPFGYEKRFAVSALTGLCITILSGLWSFWNLNLTNVLGGGHFGFPFVWIVQLLPPEYVLGLSVRYLYLNFFITTLFVFVIWTVGSSTLTLFIKQTFFKDMKNRYRVPKKSIQGGGNWENSPAFVKYK